MYIAMKTFGCRLNRAESLELEARLAADGHEIVPCYGDVSPNAILVRGCSVTAHAQRDCEKEIERLRRKFPHAHIIIGGCLPDATDLSNAIPGISEQNTEVETKIHTGTVPVVSDATSRAYLKVQDGCSGKCAFCIVPQFRGKPRSVPFNEVLSKARDFLAAGYRELVVTGCNLALYRSNGCGLPELLAALAEIRDMPNLPCDENTGDAFTHRVRLGSLEPGICDDKLLEAFASHENICRFIHISLQSGSNNVLRRMNRPYTIETVSRFREKAFNMLGSNLSIGADLIAGFPGETDADFAETLSFIDSAHYPFTNLHVFPYSERPGTPAATMDGSIPHSVRTERARILELHGIAARSAFAKSFIGRTVDVCVERGGEHGWTGEYLRCHLSSPAKRRSIVRITVGSANGDILHQ